VLTERDPAKARLNARKHGVAFADAVASLEDEGALTMRDPLSVEEERWVTIGSGRTGAHAGRGFHLARRKTARDFGAKGDGTRTPAIRGRK
jgi:uncharacterized DUF497 family protein